MNPVQHGLISFSRLGGSASCGRVSRPRPSAQVHGLLDQDGWTSTNSALMRSKYFSCSHRAFLKSRQAGVAMSRIRRAEVREHADHARRHRIITGTIISSLRRAAVSSFTYRDLRHVGESPLASLTPRCSCAWRAPLLSGVCWASRAARSLYRMIGTANLTPHGREWQVHLPRAFALFSRGDKKAGRPASGRRRGSSSAGCRAVEPAPR